MEIEQSQGKSIHKGVSVKLISTLFLSLITMSAVAEPIQSPTTVTLKTTSDQVVEVSLAEVREGFRAELMKKNIHAEIDIRSDGSVVYSKPYIAWNDERIYFDFEIENFNPFCLLMGHPRMSAGHRVKRGRWSGKKIKVYRLDNSSLNLGLFETEGSHYIKQIRCYK